MYQPSNINISTVNHINVFATILRENPAMVHPTENMLSGSLMLLPEKKNR
jgi:hypothetical protein